MAQINLITRGDDAGSNHTANAAILETYQNGLLRNVSVMAPCAALRDAANLLAGESGLCCGLHCTITAEWDNVRWGPLLPSERVPSLVDAHGQFFQSTQTVRDRQPAVAEIMAELQAQLDLVRERGFDIRYADVHMGFLWVADGLPEAFDRWCQEQGMINACSFEGLPWGFTKGDPVEQLIARLQTAPSGTYVVVGHPAYNNAEMRTLGHKGYEGPAVALEREWQRRMFTDPRIMRYCQEHGVQPIRYDQAAEL